jgi:hypothetical protein
MEEIRLLNEAIELERVRREESLSRNEALRAELQGLGVSLRYCTTYRVQTDTNRQTDRQKET